MVQYTHASYFEKHNEDPSVETNYSERLHSFLQHLQVNTGVIKKVNPRPPSKGPEGEQRYSSVPSLTPMLEAGKWLMPHPRRFTIRNDPVSTVYKAG